VFWDGFGSFEIKENGMKTSKKIIALLALLFLWSGVSDAAMVRLKNIAKVKGVRDNQLIGYGLVVGLQRTGDTQRMASTLQSVTNMLSKFGIAVSPNDIRTRNAAAVMVTAKLPPLLKSGDRIDVTVSSVGDARSLQGGTLLLTPLQGPDGQVYAVAQGPVAVGGFSDTVGDMPSIQVNQTNTGRVPEGALVEREVAASFVSDNVVSLHLIRPDFGQAAIVVAALNQQFGEPLAKASDGGQINVVVPYNYQDNLVEFVAVLENTTVMTDSPSGRVVVNERTGTVVLGQDVRVDAVAVAHGNLKLVVRNTTQVTRNAMFGYNELIHTTEIQAEDASKKGNLIVLPEGANLMDIVEAINAVGATPRDLISILQAIRTAGALHAELEII
jgi:flagellar P-ring protein FlgI